MKRTLIFIYFFLISFFIFAQSFTAKIDDVSGYYRLTFTVSSREVSNFNPPSLSGFNVLSGPNTSTFSNFQMINGKTSHSESTTFTYILSAQKSGKITIGPASVQVGKKTLRSQPVSINAKAGKNSNGSHSSAGQGEDEEDHYGHEVQQAGSKITERDIFIDVTPSKTRVKEQEAVLLTYKVHAKVGVGLANTQLTEIPDFKGFISQEIPLPGNQIQTNIEHRNGATYRTGTILQYVLFPQKNGKINIPSITFDCTVVQQRQPMNLADAFFNGGGNIGVQIRRSVPVTTIQVDSLPQPKPNGFSGGVGHFSMQGKLLNGEIKTNDIATYRVTLEGVGNLKLITAPNMSFPTDFDTYDVKTKEATEVTPEGLKGKVTYDYTFVPRNVGKYTIPALKFVYFDLQAGKYQTIETQPIEVNVSKGERSNDDVDKQLSLLKSDIHDIHATGNTNRIPNMLTWGSGGFVALHLFLIALFAVAVIGLRKYAINRSDWVSRRKNNAQKMALKQLQEANALINASNPADFYAAISKALTEYVTNVFNIGQAEVNTQNIQQKFAEKGIDAARIAQFTEVLETCQFAQYAPTTENLREELYHKAVKAINDMNL